MIGLDKVNDMWNTRAFVSESRATADDSSRNQTSPSSVFRQDHTVQEKLDTLICAPAAVHPGSPAPVDAAIKSLLTQQKVFALAPVSQSGTQPIDPTRCAAQIAAVESPNQSWLP